MAQKSLTSVVAGSPAYASFLANWRGKVYQEPADGGGFPPVTAQFPPTKMMRLFNMSEIILSMVEKNTS